MRFIALASCLSILVTSSLFAVSAVAEDRVQLRDGSVYGGALVEKVPGDHLTLKLPTGEVRRFGWADLSPEAVGKSLVRLRLDSDDSQAKLYRLTEAGSLAVATSRGMAYGAYESYAPVCSVPCDTEVDPQGTYRIGGDGVTPTKAFELPALRGPDLRLHIKAGSRPVRVLGLTGVYLGVASIVTGATLYLTGDLVNSHSVDGSHSSLPTVGLVTLAVGAAVTVAGIVGVVESGTSVTTEGGDTVATNASKSRWALTPGGVTF
jgi:hypothetical protein